VTRLRILLARLRGLFRARASDRDLQEEIAAHLDEAAADFVQQGFSAPQARRAALLQFGGLARMQEMHREARAFPSWDHIRFAFRAGARGLRRSPRSSLVAVLTLAVGIGTTTAVFSVVDGVLLRPLPFRDPVRLVALNHVTPASRTDALPAAAYFTYREHGRVFEDIGLWKAGTVSVTRGDGTVQVPVLGVTDGLLSLLGTHAELGRLIGPEDDSPDAPLRVMLTHSYWERQFGEVTDVVGQSLTIDGSPAEILGVLPPSFRLLDGNPDLLVPLRLNKMTTLTGAFVFNGVARLRPRVTIDQANADVARMIPLISQEFPLAPGITQEMWNAIGLAPNVRRLSEVAVGDMGRPLWLVLGCGVIVLLVAWTNVANLLLVRADGRRREFGIRGALGASRGRLAGELLAETVTLGLAGAVLGVLFADAGIHLLKRIAPAALPRLDAVAVNQTVLLAALATSVATSLLFGLIPVLGLRRVHAGLLQGSGRSHTDSPGRHRARSILVVAQIALSLVLLVFSGLMARTFLTMRHVDPGFVRPAEVHAFDIAIPQRLIRDPQQVTVTYQQMAQGLRHVSSVSSAGIGSIRMDGIAGKAPIYVDGQTVSGLPPVGSTWSIGGGYFETLGIRLVAGRPITWNDIERKVPVAVVAETVARGYWDTPARAIGQRIGFSPTGPWQQIVGVAGDVRGDGLNQPAPRLVYLPLADPQFVSRNVTVLVRSSRAEGPGLVRELRRAIWSVNPNVPVANVRTLDAIEANSTSRTSFATTMLAVAAGMALVLALVGVYAVVAHLVAERTREIGIRIALGADGARMRTLFLRHGLVLAVVGTVPGLAAAWLLAPAMSSQLYGIGPSDPVTYAGASIAMAAVTLLATYVPARRASRVDPVAALHSGE
jgi:putative ABC transport system permease protein